MSLNNRAFWRNATRFNRLLVKLSPFKADPTNWMNYGGLPLMVIQAPPNQSTDIFQVQDSAGNILYAIGPTGRPAPSAPQRAITAGAATGVVDIAVPASAMVGGTIHYVARVSDGTDFQALSGIVTYSGVNKAGTVTGTAQEVTANQAKTVTGASTLTAAWTTAVSANKLTVRVALTTSLVPTTCDVTLTVTPVVGAATVL